MVYQIWQIVYRVQYSDIAHRTAVSDFRAWILFFVSLNLDTRMYITRCSAVWSLDRKQHLLNPHSKEKKYGSSTLS